MFSLEEAENSARAAKFLSDIEALWPGLLAHHHKELTRIVHQVDSDIDITDFLCDLRMLIAKYMSKMASDSGRNNAHAIVASATFAVGIQMFVTSHLTVAVNTVRKQAPETGDEKSLLATSRALGVSLSNDVMLMRCDELAQLSKAIFSEAMHEHIRIAQSELQN